MELKIQEVQVPEQIPFNYEELKSGLLAEVKKYETVVYSPDQIKEAKQDRANLNKLKKALNDERIRREREYMTPFEDFKGKINELIAIIDKPVGLIDSQIKAVEGQQREDKAIEIASLWADLSACVEWLGIEHLNIIFDEKWLNATTKMATIEAEIKERIEQIKKDLHTLATMPLFSFEATEEYKRTLDIDKAITEGQRVAEIQSKKEEAQTEVDTEESKPESSVEDDGQEKMWIRFEALLSMEDALELKQFFDAKGIEFRAV